MRPLALVPALLSLVPLADSHDAWSGLDCGITLLSRGATRAQCPGFSTAEAISPSFSSSTTGVVAT
jgi:hypothetical protein